MTTSLDVENVIIIGNTSTIDFISTNVKLFLQDIFVQKVVWFGTIKIRTRFQISTHHLISQREN